MIGARLMIHGARRQQQVQSWDAKGRVNEVDPIFWTKRGCRQGVACSGSLVGPWGRGLWELWETRSVFQGAVGERSVSLVHSDGSFHSPR